MTTSPSMLGPRGLAKGFASLLWLAGSAFLIRYELQAPSPDWVVIVTTPLVWAVVIALPILAHHALKAREIVAGGLLALAALVGSAYTLQGTIARQSETHDIKINDAQAQNFTLDEKRQDLERAKQRYDDAQRFADDERGSGGCGKRCQDWQLRATEVASHIDLLTRQIAAMGSEKPVAAGETRIATLLALVLHKQASDVQPWVNTVTPNLLGLFLELAALALGLYGWRPQTKPFPALESVRESVEIVPERQRAVIETLSKAGRPLSNSELAFLMSCSEGEASRRVKAIDGKVRKVMSGRKAQISLLN